MDKDTQESCFYGARSAPQTRPLILGAFPHSAPPQIGKREIATLFGKQSAPSFGA